MSCPSLRRNSIEDQRIKPSSPKTQIIKSNYQKHPSSLRYRTQSFYLLFALFCWSHRYQLTLTHVNFPGVWSRCSEIADVREKLPPISFLISFQCSFPQRQGTCSQPILLLCTCLHSPHKRTKPLNCYDCSSSSLDTPPNSPCANLISSNVRACQTWGVSLYLIPSIQQQLAHPAAV